MIRYIKLDETKHWREDIKALAGQILGVYLYDDASVTHCCEITPSFELNFVEYQYTAAIEDDAKLEEMHDHMLDGEASTEPVTYMHVAAVSKLESFPLEGHDSMEDALEYARGNSL